MSFKEEPLSIKIYLVLVVLGGAVFLAFNVPPREVLSGPYLFFVVLHIAIERLRVRLPRGQSDVTVGFANSLAIIIIFGPAAAAWIYLVSFFTYKHSWSLYKKYYYRFIFNVSQLALAAGLGGYAYYYAGGTLGQVNLPADLIPIIVCTTVYFAVNTVLMTTVLSLSQRVSFWGIWLTNFRWSVVNYLAIAPLGVLLAVVYINMGIIGVLLLIIPLMIARHTFIMYMDIRNQYLSTIKALTKAIDAKDHYTHGHSERVAQYAVEIGQELKLQEDFLEKLEYLALMHDIGKIAIPENVLNKPTKLSDDEFNMVRDHSAVGAEIISDIKLIGEHADIVRHHHEHLDGSGYPDGLQGKEISTGAKIVCVADAFDAMTSERVYRKPASKKEAAEELQRCASTQFCPQVVGAFIKVLQRKGEI